MIKKIEIKNFRSILDSSVDLKDLTVIVGANATGKSNLIKAIDFISDLTDFGLQETVYKRGGFGGIIPKQHKSIFDKEIYLKLEFELEPPENWIKHNLPPLSVEYEIAFVRTRRTPLKITKESLKAKSILLLNYYLENDFHKEDNVDNKLEIESDRLTDLIGSEIYFYRNKKNNIQYDINFKLTKENNSLFFGWLGLKNFFQANNRTFTSYESQRFVKSLINNQKSGTKKKELPILSADRAFFGINSHLRKILNEIRSYGRYDLLINELRQEQSISSENKVSVTGNNMPSVVKRFVKENKVGWQRVITTMSNISPYFANVYSESLRAGKEYLLFKEVFGGRNIEAWESSDGTLRALAILISIEAHKKGSTVLIEEPEHGLHPWAVKELISHIREVVELRDLQVLITTHSQQVLENIEKSELLITERDEKGTKYSTIDSIIPDADISMGEIGELWTRGLLRGVPTTF
jgi:predicted ATPase